VSTQSFDKDEANIGHLIYTGVGQEPKTVHSPRKKRIRCMCTYLPYLGSFLGCSDDDDDDGKESKRWWRGDDYKGLRYIHSILYIDDG